MLSQAAESGLAIRADLEVLDRLLRERMNTDVIQLRAEFDCRDDETLFWSGSWVDGFANSKSDLDFYLIGGADRQNGDAEVTALGLPPIYETMTAGEMRLDVTVVSAELIIGIAGYLSAYRHGLDHPAIWSDNLREFVHRLRIGVPLVNVELFERLRSIVDFDQFTNYLVGTYHRGVDSLREDVVGLIDEGDLVSAYFNARRRCDLATDMLLAARGETNTRTDKWRWKKLQRVHGVSQRIREAFLDCSSVDLRDDDCVRSAIDRCLRLGDRLVNEAV